jgi:hypothetical protein
MDKATARNYSRAKNTLSGKKGVTYLKQIKVTDEAHHWLRLLAVHLDKEMSELATDALMRTCREHLPPPLLTMMQTATAAGPSPAGERRGHPDRRETQEAGRGTASRRKASRK